MSQSQKRPDSQSDSTWRTKQWVGGVSGKFTVFDEGIVSDVDWSLFDGQLSEVTDSDLKELSNGGSVLPSLTESGSEDE